MSDFDHIHPKFRYTADLSVPERLGFLEEPRWVGYEQANKLVDILRGLMLKPKRPRMPNLLIVGDPNNGKTTVLQHFFDLHGQAYADENMDPIKPIILTQSPPSPDEKGLYIAILECFWVPYRSTDSTAKLRYQVIHLMRESRTQLLVIDEFHSLLAGSLHKQREVMNAIKFLCNSLLIPIVGAGTREAVRVLHTDPQHASRFDVVTLPNWELDKEFQSLLSSFESTLPLKKASKLFQPELATILHAYSDGNLGNLHRLLVECAAEALRSGREVIDKTIIESFQWLKPTRGIREVKL